jgi:pimeloyl-ACP methyl ester carboxylesterase
MMGAFSCRRNPWRLRRTLPAMTTVEANGITISYERAGNGPPLLFCGGSGSTIAESRLVAAPLVEHFDVVVYDARGLGDTSIPPPPYKMSDYAADAVALADRFGWPTFRLAGISFGGMVAQELAVTWPERVERLVLLCTSPGGAGGSSYPLHELAELPPVDAAEIGIRLLDTRFDPDWLREHPNDRALVEMFAGRRASPKTDEQQVGIDAQLEARSHHDVCDRLDRITCPTFIGAGRFDGIAPLANSEAIAARIPNGELHVYDGGHAFVAQDPAAFPEMIRFLA